MIKRLVIDDFLSLAKHNIVLDVRSPGEYAHAHIPGAYSLPLFSDEERKVVGTAYKQDGREQAIKIGLDYFGVKMRKMVEEVEQINLKFKSAHPNIAGSCILIHCWRGGMRSAGVAWLLDLYGFEVYTLDGGYKSFRNWVLQQFEIPYSFKILGGYTGSGKTAVLQQLKKEKQPIIDLEGIAQHKGSAFGGIGQPKQPTQEMFENMLAIELQDINKVAEQGAIWLEDESSRIGSINLSPVLWHTMRKSPVYFLDVPFEERLSYIAQEYGKLEKKELIDSIIRIKKRLGGMNTRDAISHIMEGDIKEGFRILLRYYDKYYSDGLQQRKDSNCLITIIPCNIVDAEKNTNKLINEKTIA